MIFNLENLDNLDPLGSMRLKDPRLYSQRRMVAEMQRQLKVLSSLLILLILAVMLFFNRENYTIVVNGNYLWVIGLAIYVNVASRLTFEIKILQILGMTLLAVSSTAHLYIAHQVGSINPLILVNIILLFMIMPLLPQGLRQLATISVAIYLLLSLSVTYVDNHIDLATLHQLNWILVSIGLASQILVLRSIQNRKKKNALQGKLAIARAELFNIYHRDRLTGAWNRGYLNTALNRLFNDFQQLTHFYHFIVIDLDRFSELNNTFGREFGDRVLKKFSETLIKSVAASGYLIRLGGDEFILLLVHDAPDSLMTTLELSIRLQIKQEKPEAEFGLIWGSVIQPLRPIDDPESVYREAEKALTLLKQASPNSSTDGIDEKETIHQQFEFFHSVN